MLHVTDTAVISSFFNYHNFQAPARNLRRWKRMMDSLHVPSFGVELVLAEQTPVSKGWEGWRQIVVNLDLHAMWQKEAALNLCVHHIPAHFTKLIVCDPDVWFENPHWFVQTSAMLNHVNVCSPFTRAHWTGPDGVCYKGANAYGTKPTHIYPGYHVHAGFAIGIRRSFWDKDGVNGLYPYAIVGGGDVALGVALVGNDATGLSFYQPEISHAYSDYVARASRWCAGKISHIQGNLYHEHHGALKDRRYDARNICIRGFAPEKHLKFTNSGLLEWLPSAPEKIRSAIVEYFKNRREDD